MNCTREIFSDELISIQHVLCQSPQRFLYRDGVEKNEQHSQAQSFNVKAILKTSDYGGYPQSPHSMKTKGSTWIDTNGGGSFVSTYHDIQSTMIIY